MSSLSRWLTATSGVLAVAVAVTWGGRRLSLRHDVEVTPPRRAGLEDIRARLLATDTEVRLEALRDWVDHAARAVAHRQPALDVLCEALRELPWPGTQTDQRWRMVLQATITAHLRPGPGFWLGSDLDLRHTTLVDFDLSRCRVRDVRLDGTRLLGETRFDETTFLGEVSADGACFGRHALFTQSVFARGLSLRGTAVCGNGEFSHLQVAGPVTLRGARFAGRADFTCARFGSDLDSAGVRYGGRAVFRRAWFTGAASFAGAWFRGREDFVDAAFGGETSFENTRFGHRIHAD